ncbi:MAG: hypothetical protein IJU92_03575 [Spirochaetaceae bacterium]|nr:hypothetical protein [Spirochaetaceae bacterium]
MKKHTILNSYKNGLTFFALILIATLVLIVFAGVIVFPLWLFSQKAPALYTIVVCTLMGIAIVLGFWRIIRKKISDSAWLLSLAKVFIFLLFFALAIFALFAFNRLVALVFVIIPCIISFVLNLVTSKQKKE